MAWRTPTQFKGLGIMDWIGREYEKTKKGNRIKPKFSFYDNAERKISS
ncbi:MAG: hypothetical protein ACTHLL_04695 [Candidatus Nitrosocosmicus sp.]